MVLVSVLGAGVEAEAAVGVLLEPPRVFPSPGNFEAPCTLTALRISLRCIVDIFGLINGITYGGRAPRMVCTTWLSKQYGLSNDPLLRIKTDL